MRCFLAVAAFGLLLACSSEPRGDGKSDDSHAGGTAGTNGASGGATTGGSQNSGGTGGASPGTGGAGGAANTGGADSNAGGASAGGATGGSGGAAGSDAAGGTGGGSDVMYATSFDADESPITEGGVWKHNNPWFTEVVTSGGNVHGTSPNPANSGKYEDSYAFLGGMGFPPDQYASGTVYKNGTTGGYLEIELQLRVSDSADSTQGYECFLHQAGEYISVARWSGGALSAPATLDYFDILGGAAYITAPNDGDLFEAQIVGNIITVKLAGAVIATVDVSEFDGDVIDSGDPGIGFDAGASGAETGDSTYGFKDFSAKGL